MKKSKHQQQKLRKQKLSRSELKKTAKSSKDEA